MELTELAHRRTARISFRIGFGDREQESKRRLFLRIIACGLDNTAPHFRIFDSIVKALQCSKRATVVAVANGMSGLPSQLFVFSIVAHDVGEERLFATDLTQPEDGCRTNTLVLRRTDKVLKH